MKNYVQYPRPHCVHLSFAAAITARLGLLALLALSFAAAPRGRAENLQIQKMSPGILLSWTSTNAILQSAYYLSGPWAYVTSGSNAFNTMPMASEQFFRLVIMPGGGTNTPEPQVENQSYLIGHDTLLSILPDGVLAGSTAVDSNSLAATLYAEPENGTVTLSADGAFLYVPNTGFVGTDMFQFIAYDGSLASGIGTVSITVTDSPPAAVNDMFGIQMNTTGGAAAPGVLRNDTAASGDVMTATLAGTTTNGVLALHSDGSFEYTPNPGFVGNDYFTYVASTLGGTSAVATVTLVVHGPSAPPTAYPTNYTMAHDQTLTVAAPGLLLDTSDPSMDPMTATIVTAPASGTAIVMADGSFSYEPTNGFTGTDSFTWAAVDVDSGSNSLPATVTITVTNGVPLAVADTFYVTPGVPFNIVAPGVLENDSDPEQDPLTAILVTGPSNGVLTFNTNGSFSYIPGASFTGTDTFTYEATDGVSTSAPATVSLVVSNRPLAGQPDKYSLLVNQTLNVSAPGVLINDSDIESGMFIPTNAVLVTGPVNGSLTFSNNGGFAYVPTTGYAGTDSFTYEIVDAYATSAPVAVTLTIITKDMPPYALEDEYTMLPNSTLEASAINGVLLNDRDEANCHLTAVLASAPANGSLTLNSDGTFTYTPDANYQGVDTFTYTANNGIALSAPATVSITVTDAPPVSAPDFFGVHGTNVLTVYAPGILDNDYDPNDGVNISAYLVAGPSHGVLSLDPSGEFTYTATNGYLGYDKFTYIATDGTVTGAVTEVSIAVTNGVPVAGADEETTTKNTALAFSAPGVLAFCYDPDDDPLTAVLISGPTNAASFTLNADGSYTYTPAAGFIGTDSFIYAANDGYTNSPPATVAITVTSASEIVRTPGVNPPAKELDLKAIAFLGGTPVVSDTARPFIGGPPQWLDNGDGIINPFLGEHSWPYSYARGNTLYCRVVFHTPNRNAFRAANGRYIAMGLRGRVTANGVAAPNQIITPLRPFAIVPDFGGPGGTIYADMSCAAQFGGTVGVVNLNVVWEYTVNNGGTWTRCAAPNTPAIAAAGTSFHKIYLTWGTPQAWPMFETEVAVGCLNGAGVSNPNVLLSRIWNEFRNQRATRIDGTPMTYYNNWNVPTIGGVPDLLYLHDGRCGQWALFFIGCLQAQGMAPFTMRPAGVYAVNPYNPVITCQNNVNFPFMVANWNFGAPGPATPNYGIPFQAHAQDPLFNFENIPILNGIDTFPPYCASPLPFGIWGFQWAIAPEVDYVGGNGANKGQNNPNPRPMFTDHAIVNYAGVYFDPSYGSIYQNNVDMQNQAISGLCVQDWQTDFLPDGVTPIGLIYPVLHIMQNQPWQTPIFIYICNK